MISHYHSIVRRVWIHRRTPLSKRKKSQTQIFVAQNAQMHDHQFPYQITRVDPFNVEQNEKKKTIIMRLLNVFCVCVIFCFFQRDATAQLPKNAHSHWTKTRDISTYIATFRHRYDRRHLKAIFTYIYTVCCCLRITAMLPIYSSYLSLIYYLQCINVYFTHKCTFISLYMLLNFLVNAEKSYSYI